MTVTSRRPREYDLAVSLPRDLSALARRDDHHDSFTRSNVQATNAGGATSMGVPDL